ncbi:MAG: transaldolase [Armatimonadetes bacterium]|nr:transaldolase [Armatimonadota bacterium]
MNSLQLLHTLGQSPWLDFIRRNYIQDGSLQKLIDQGILGVTSNPAIFEKAIAGSTDYDHDIVMLTGEGLSAEQIYDHLSIADVGMAADLFRPVWERTNGIDGYVSLEVSPELAHDTEATISEARRLWDALNRPNVMIKVPATEAGIPAIRTLIADGIPVNVTLLFSVERYRAVALAYLEGLEARAAKKLPLQISSVASFFVSRVDSLLDPVLESKAPELQGKIAIANSLAAYDVYLELFRSPRFAELAEQGAIVQRLLWASTSAKNPAYSPILYIEELIAEDTVNTMPLETIEAYLESGDPMERVSGHLEEARHELETLADAGVSLDEAAAELERDAVEKFVVPFRKLLEAIDAKRESVVAS